ncbi:MAG TPA: hypothetical protein ENH32_01520 [Proteobacteria bacterium]|nr:hypothetical protein [Pseudomonadota bacterium]
MRGKVFLFLAIILAVVAVAVRFFPFDKTPPTVSIHPAPGTYNKAVSVVFTTEEGAVVFYSIGDQALMPYLVPVTLRDDAKIRYFARDHAGNGSEIQTSGFHVRLDTEPPVTMARPKGGKYNHPISVRLTSEKDAVTRFTVDGSVPGDDSPVYSKPITIKRDASIKFFSMDKAENREGVRTEVYHVLVDNTRPVTIADPSGGLFNSPVTVSLIGEKGARIHYTLDGGRPTSRSRSYLKPITFQRSGVLRFFAVDGAGNRETVREERYVIDTKPPVVKVKPHPGTYGAAINVTLSSNEKGAIRYETGEREPGPSSPIYHGAIMLTRSMVLKYFAVDEAGNRGKIASAAFVIDTTPPTVTPRPKGGNYSGRIRVKLETSEPADIFYTLDGSPVTRQSLKYRGPINVAGNAILSYFAVDKVGNRSDAASQRYVLDRTPPVTSVDPGGGVFAGPIRVVLKTEDNAVIRYTTDTSTPSEASPEYENPVPVTRDTVLKFFATDESGNREVVKSVKYTFDHTPPSTTVDPPAGIYSRPVSVSLKSEKGGRIFVRTGAQGKFSIYGGPFVLSKSGKIFFYSEDETGNREQIQMAEYIIDSEPPNTIAYPAPGQYNPPITLELKSEKNAVIRYTLDGAEPTDRSPKYTVPLVLRDKATVRFFAVDRAGNHEKVRTASYTVVSGLWRDNTNGVFIFPSVLDGKFLWVGGQEGLFRVNIINKRRKNFTIRDGLISNSVRAIAVDRLGFKWIGTDKGVSQFDGLKNWVTFDYGDGLPSNFINCIVVDQKRNLWFGTDKGLARFDGNSFKVYTSRDGLPDNNVNALAIDANGVFWIGTDKGLASFHDKVIRVFTHVDGLPSDRVTAVAVDGRWNVWIGTGDSGIARYDGKKWVIFGPDQGFFGRSVPVIAVDLSDNKWFHTDKGVFKFDGNRFSVVKMPVYR